MTITYLIPGIAAYVRAAKENRPRVWRIAAAFAGRDLIDTPRATCLNES